jgi:hypothetical protein
MRQENKNKLKEVNYGNSYLSKRKKTKIYWKKKTRIKTVKVTVQIRKGSPSNSTRTTISV